MSRIAPKPGSYPATPSDARGDIVSHTLRRVTDSPLDRALVDELFVTTQPNHLQKRYSDKLTAEERDLLRADMLRERLRTVSRPKPKPGAPPADSEKV